MLEPKTIVQDTETTGLVKKIQVPGKRPGTTRKEQIPYETMYNDYPYIVEWAWKVGVKGETRSFIINQEGREIPKEASDIHGITTEIANASGFYFPAVFLAFADDCRDSKIVVGHNIYYDTSIIKANVLRYIETGKLDEGYMQIITGILHKHKRIDTLRSTMKMMGGFASLSKLHMKIFRKGFDAHGAGPDVDAVARCYEWLLRKGIVPTYEELQAKAREKMKNEVV